MRKPKAKTIILTVVAAVIIAPIIYLFLERRAGAKLWEEARESYVQAGNSLEVSSLFGPEISDEENFAAIPELIGITELESGEQMRFDLEKLGLKGRRGKRKSPSGRSRSRSRSSTQPQPRIAQPKGSNVRGKLNLQELHDYLLDTVVIPVNAKPDDYAEDILQAFEAKHGALIDALAAATERPKAAFLPRLADRIYPDDYLLALSFPDLHSSSQIARGMRIYSTAAIYAGDPAAAAQGVLISLKVAEASNPDQALLLSNLVAVAVRSITMESIWEGLREQSWDQPTLESIGNSLQRAQKQVRQHAVGALQSELIASLDGIDRLPEEPFDPEDLGLKNKVYSWAVTRIWLDHNRAFTVDFMRHGLIVPLKDTGLNYRQIEVRRIVEFRDRFDDSTDNPRTALGRIFSPAFGPFVKKTAEHETMLLQAITACALERYFLEKDEYPDSLQDLVPEFLDKVPIDPMDHRPMRYRRTKDDGRYQIHSIGWDGVDQGGVEGDLTWFYKVDETLTSP